MILEFLDLTGLGALLAQLKEIFGFKSDLNASADLRRQYLLEVDYDKELAFDITEIITDEDIDIILEKNEAVMLTASGEILVNINDEYIVIERGE